MKNSSLVVVYGSYGYTGSLIVKLCRQKNIQVMLAGRNKESLRKQSEESGYPNQVVESSDMVGLKKLLGPAALVIHCGGPFRHTASFMSEACIATKTHYTDITGEYQVFESMAALDAQAKNAGIMIMPGTGFDVVPSDCLAAHLKKRLPSATHLQLGFMMSEGGSSRGTKKSVTEGLGHPGFIRKDGQLTPIALGEKVMEINFGTFKSNTLNIPWGDISTAWRSTEIPNIEVYMGATDSMIRNAKRSKYFGWILRQSWLKNYLLRKIDQGKAGPSEQRREKSRSFLWGKVWDGSGKECVSRLEAPNGYALTAQTSVLIAEKILQGNFKTGYQTPAMAYGADLILEIPTTKRTDQ